MRALRPDVIVNPPRTPPWTKPRASPSSLRKLNAEGPRVLASRSRRRSARCSSTTAPTTSSTAAAAPPRTEDAPTGPLSVYGRTKLDGENHIRASGCAHLILRTSWVYAARGGNFARTMIKLASERDALSVIDDQFGAPTGAELLADVTAHAIRACRADAKLCGTYHAVAGGETNWFEYARFVIEWARANGLPIKVAADAIKPVPTSGYPRRPNAR